MRLRSSMPLLAGELTQTHQWRLVAMLYAQQRTLVQGSLATAAIIVVCLVRTSWLGFAVLLAACLVILTWRRTEYKSFSQLPAPPDGSPERWARRFVWGASAAACVWAATSVCAAAAGHDGALLIFVFMVQAGWLGGMAMRNAVSPACVAAQVLITTAGFCLAVALTPLGLPWVALPFWLVFARAVLSLGNQLAADTVRMMRSEQKLEEANRQLTEMSHTDGLTLIGNRRAFDVILQTEWVRATRAVNSVALLMLDVDFFKLYNDRYGHPAGDSCLRAIAATIAGTTRQPPDFVARFGGEEFVALLPNTGESGAREVAERVQRAVRQLALSHEASPFGMITLSIGISSVVHARTTLRAHWSKARTARCTRPNAAAAIRHAHRTTARRSQHGRKWGRATRLASRCGRA